MTVQPPVSRTTVVRCSPERAFDAFTGQIGASMPNFRAARGDRLCRNTSAPAMSERKVARSSGSFTSRAIDCLPRLAQTKKADSPCTTLS